VHDLNRDPFFETMNSFLPVSDDVTRKLFKFVKISVANIKKWLH